MKQNKTISSIIYCLERNLKENLIYNKILTPIETMDKQGYKIFKCEDNIPNFEQWSYGVLNINDGVYYKIDLNTTLNYFSNTTFESCSFIRCEFNNCKLTGCSFNENILLDINFIDVNELKKL